MGFVEDFERNREKAARERSVQWFADHQEIPDLDFFPPDCSICWAKTDVVDDGWITCEVCDVSWPPNGYGHEATRSDGSDIESLA